MRLWQTAQTCLAMLAISLMLASCGGNGSSSTSASSLPLQCVPDAESNSGYCAFAFSHSNAHRQCHGD